MRYVSTSLDKLVAVTNNGERSLSLTVLLFDAGEAYMTAATL